MTRKILHRALRISRGLVLVTGAVVVSAVVLGAATAALAAAPGDPFRLGKGNAINKVTKLVGKAPSPRLVIDNNGNGVALRLLVEPGKPPMQINSSKKVARLNADRLDNLDQSAFLRKNGKAADADRLDGKDSVDFYAADSKVADSSHADWSDGASIAFNARDADRLDGKDSTQFLRDYNFRSVSSAYNSSDMKELTAYCPSGLHVLGGGAWVSPSLIGGVSSSSTLDVALIASNPVMFGPDAWKATADEMGATDSNWRLIVYVICANT